jgi:crotonobetainyl-CoA:carnitine CoA-transferase CaiB-like acyl-CoA transferase
MPHASLDELIALSGLPAPASGQVEISGGDPVFPTRYRIGNAGAAALAATGLAASHLWTLRGGKPQQVAVDLRAAAASLRGARYMTLNARPLPAIWDAYSGFYPTLDQRWVSIHCNFANHREAALKVLGAPADRDAAMKASATWTGLALEDAIHAAGGCAGLVRTEADWALHPQSAAVALQPLLEIERIGDAPPEPLHESQPTASRPLAGIRVLDLTRVLAGPTCARTLAEHGADVLKVTAAHLPDSGLVDLDTGLGKLATRIDLRSTEGNEQLRGLIREADVFSQSYRPGALATRGFSPEALAELRPGIVYVTLSAWGTSGPWRERRGFDSIVQCVSGIAYATGTATQPRLLMVSAIDYVAGYLMALGAMAALARRAREGGSWIVRVSLARTGKWIVDQGLVTQEALAGVPDELSEAEIQALCTETDAPDGKVRHLKPVVGLSETPPYWARPPVPLGFHAPVWPPRG